MTKPLLLVLSGQVTDRPPTWFMRQAGRYLPEYRALRAETPDFLSFCLDPVRASEATLQPIRRFGFDGAILFSDILVIPHALGQSVRFEAGEGPVLGNLPSPEDLNAQIDAVTERLAPVGETVRRVKAELPQDVTLIGFCGGPWTVMTYMLNGRKAHDRTLIRSFIYENPQQVAAIMDVVIEASARYLKLQAENGAEVLKIFESWAEGFPDALFDQWVIDPHIRLMKRLRALGVDLPVIGFPRGAEAKLMDYVGRVPVQCVGLGTATPWKLGQFVQSIRPIEGALDPVVLRAGGEALKTAISDLKAAWGKGPWIFNLGHGIFPDTPISHVEDALRLIRA